MVVIVRYAEVGLKSRPVRARMEKALVKHLVNSTGAEVSREFGRIYVHTEKREHAEIAARVFGVVSASLAREVSSDFNALVGEIVKYARHKISDGESFALRVRRTGEHTYTSKELAEKAGEEVVKKTGASVDLENPDREIHVEVRGVRAFLFQEIIPGVGGLPYGTQGKAVMLVSGGIDSPVAAFMAMRRGIEPVALFMDPSPLVDERTRKRALDAVGVLSGFTPEPLKTYIAPYGDVLLEQLKVKQKALGCVLCKRTMLRTAELIAREENAKAIVTGESIGQVASQTLDNISAISRVISLPVFRPLVGMDKNDIIEKAREIGTYEVSIQPANCCLGPPPKPATKATPERAERAESNLEVDTLVKKMVEEADVEMIP